ncbi:glycoside hydrolase family 25 protein [Rhizobium sp. SSA_523]|uniref:glycoside hydrolase family 25 protein n=1 Tax=Rhizobium sp. SSA_523 TaxID=2952477 RepID=UPI00209041D3|nr:glycoside hydrolase family 25 protein [Rhizobium sp. SSA_523]MCO5730317.1 glycoside hydrolase family 25 protein [Rhizobium sp. SSA_523]WKC25368.1 glycoside hydrolase family 25 protein [Rhizobium sp. SSA_523]
MHFIISLLIMAAALSGCTSTGPEALTAGLSAPKQRFKDKDPQDFGHRHPGRHPIHGIDVSKWNGDVDWAKVRNAGVDFVFIKATEGGDRVDAAFQRNWRGAATAGLAHAPFHFYYFCTGPDEQADWFTANVPKSALTMPPVLDVEWNPGSPTCKTRPEPAAVRAVMARFLSRIEAHYGKRPIIYTSVDFHRENLVGHFRNYPFWVRSVAAHPEEIYPGRDWSFWQYTSTGVIPGIGGDTDINVFNGTARHWEDWLGRAGKS